MDRTAAVIDLDHMSAQLQRLREIGNEQEALKREHDDLAEAIADYMAINAHGAESAQGYLSEAATPVFSITGVDAYLNQRTKP